MTNYLKCTLFGKKKQITYNGNCHTAIGKESITYTKQYIKLNMFATSITVSVSKCVSNGPRGKYQEEGGVLGYFGLLCSS